MATTIAWTNESWNPIAAFDKVTGKRGWICVHHGIDCLNCYAETLNNFRGNGHKYRIPSLDKVEFRLVNLKQPLSWKEPRMIFVCSMTDLFLDAYSDDFIFAVFVIMAAAEWHTFQVLTKRAERSRDFSNWLAQMTETELVTRVATVCGSLGLSEWFAANAFARLKQGPLSNVWRGVSVGNQIYAEERILPLLQTRAAVRFLSAEPLLSALDLTDLRDSVGAYQFNALTGEERYPGTLLRSGILGRIDWVIVGGESGAKARPCNLAWIESLVEQCRATGVACFVKQLGSVPVESAERWAARPLTRILSVRNRQKEPAGCVALKYAHPKGEDPLEWPLDLRVREFPNEVAHA